MISDQELLGSRDDIYHWLKMCVIWKMTCYDLFIMNLKNEVYCGHSENSINETMSEFKNKNSESCDIYNIGVFLLVFAFLVNTYSTISCSLLSVCFFWVYYSINFGNTVDIVTELACHINQPQLITEVILHDYTRQLLGPEF